MWIMEHYVQDTDLIRWIQLDSNEKSKKHESYLPHKSWKFV